MIITLEPNLIREFAVSASEKYLIIRHVKHSVEVLLDEESAIQLMTGDRLDISQYQRLVFSNPHNATIQVEFIKTTQKLDNGKAVSVAMPEFLPISSILEAVKTIEQTALNFVTRNHVVIPSFTKSRLVTANATRRELLIQNISNSETEALIGSSSVSAVNGLPVVGDRVRPGGLTLSHGGEVWAYNNSSSDLTISIAEVRL